MPQSLAKLYTHLVFSTKNRESIIDPIDKEELHAYMAGILNELKSNAVIINSMPDHVHLLFNLSRTVTVAKVVEDIKSSSSKWMKNRNKHWESWQSGYGAFSVSESQLRIVSNYIRNQEEHHKDLTYKQEFRKLLTKHRIEFDERYVWD